MRVQAFAPLANKTIRTQAADLLRNSILEGSLPIGSRVVERNLAQQLGTSLTAVREALIQLESEGFIVKKPNSTTHVVSLEPADIEQIFSVREVLELHAFELAAKVVKPSDIDQLEKLRSSAVDAARRREHRAYIQLDLEWHDFIWLIPGNPYLHASIRRLVLPLFMYSALQMSERQDFDLVKDNLTHAPLIEALRGGKAREARRAFLAALEQWRLQTLSGELKPSAQRAG
jgi:DNA-binding GntR family transcriptional regulator